MAKFTFVNKVNKTCIHVQTILVELLHKSCLGFMSEICQENSF